MAAIFKMSENWILPYLVNFGHFCVLFFVFSLYIGIGKKFFSNSRWRLKHYFGMCCQNFCVRFKAMGLYFDHSNYLRKYFAKLAQNGGTIQDGGSKTEY
jgi:hypothetical protein